MDFLERCIEVYQHLYNTAFVQRNDVLLFICRMVYAEVVMERAVDWTSIKSTPKIIMLEGPEIPRERKFQNGGLKKAVKSNAPEREYFTDTSDPNSNSDGSG